MFRPPRSTSRVACLHRSPCLPRGRFQSTSQPHLRTALFFPGHGVHRTSMASPWVEAFPSTCKPFLDEMDSILGCKLSSVIEDGPNAILNKSENAQPAIMAVSIMILRVLENEFGFKLEDNVDVTLGHSLGEYAALVAAGALDYPFALKMVRKRGEIMGECTRKAKEESGETYGMMALVCEPQQLDGLISSVEQFIHHGTHGSKDDSSFEVPAIEQVSIANKNSKNQIVLSGSFQRIRSLLTHLREFSGHDPRAVEIKSNSPFHNPIMKPAQEYMRTVLRDGPVTFPAKMPTISNVSARPFASKEDLKDLLARQATETVLWWDSIKYLDQEAKVKRWLGVGPGKVGRNLVGKEVGRSTAAGGGVWAISEPREVEPTLKALEETRAETVN